MEKIRLVVATQKSREDFFKSTATGRSIILYYPLIPNVEIRLFEENKKGLPEVYNIAIAESVNSPAILIFLHDDMHILDYYWQNQVRISLQHFEIVGLAGNQRRVFKQPSWAFIDDKFTRDKSENLSGIVGNGSSFPPGNLSIFGPPGREVKLLDGIMLIVRSTTLISNDIQFDERFDFHFYDMDFCRQAEEKKIKMGTWAISTIHESEGFCGTEEWKVAYKKYLEKWQG
ncbi:MAG: hypothetical protein HQL70_11235 [Magnetococcales bacterium]|nr:hypothetical protein [Magnetococcales bacterium]